MKNAFRKLGAVAACMLLAGPGSMTARDWPQWRGPNRDAKVAGFTVPATWPKELTKKWSVPVGGGVATPALAGGKLYVFTRQDTDDVLRCLDADSGKELWIDKNPAQAATTPGGKPYEGPRSSPTVADGKVVTLGARGTLSCFDAAGKLLWRKDELKGFWPQFYAASSPLVLNGLCVAHLGGKQGGRGNTEGAIAAYDLATGTEKWKWLGGSPGYGSLMLMTIGDTKLVIAETDSEIVAVNAADGKLAWQAPCKTRYNASTPVVFGETVIFEGAGGGRGEKAVKIVKKGDGFAAEDLWTNAESAVIYNSPVVAGGHLYGLTQGNQFFCLNMQTGKTAWTAALPGAPAAGGAGGGGGGRGGRGGDRGYGSVVDAGTVLLALTPRGQLVVFEPSDKEFKQIASYKVAEGQTYAYPVASKNRVYVKDAESVTLWAVE